MNILKNSKGQVLLAVMLITMIALIIALGMVARVSNLTQSVVKTDVHEAAFYKSEEYSRKILDLRKQGLDAASIVSNLTALIAGTDDASKVRIKVEDSTSIKGIVLNPGETFEVISK